MISQMKTGTWQVFPSRKVSPSPHSYHRISSFEPHRRLRSRVAHVVSRITHFSAALAVQIFCPKEHATVATLSVKVLVIILFVVMGMKVFSQNDDGRDGDARTGNNSHPLVPHQNV